MNELEEEYIPHELNTADDDQLDDVIPCAPVDFSAEPVMDAAPAFGVPGGDLYSEPAPIMPTISTGEMVDINPNAGTHLDNELEEDLIPGEDNTDDDNQLDDVVTM